MEYGTRLPAPRPAADRVPLSLRPGSCPAWCTLDHVDPAEDDFHYGSTRYVAGPVEFSFALSRDESRTARDAVSLFGLPDRRWSPADLSALGRALVEVGESAGRILT